MHLDLILYVQLLVEVHRDVFSNREYGVKCCVDTLHKLTQDGFSLVTFVVKKGVNLFNGSLDMENETKVVVILHELAHSQIQPASLSELEFPAKDKFAMSQGIPPFDGFKL